MANMGTPFLDVNYLCAIFVNLDIRMVCDLRFAEFIIQVMQSTCAKNVCGSPYIKKKVVWSHRK